MTPAEAAELLRRARVVVGRHVGKRSPVHDDLVSEVLLRVLEARCEAQPAALLGTIVRRHAPRVTRLLHPLGRAQARGVPPAVLAFSKDLSPGEPPLAPDPYATAMWRYRVHQRVEALLGDRQDLHEALAMLLEEVQARPTNAILHRRSKVRKLIAADAELRELLEECPR